LTHRPINTTSLSCGVSNPFLQCSLPLSVREWDCHNCKQHNNRDHNAAKNIRDIGLQNLSELGTNSDIKQKLGKSKDFDKSAKADLLEAFSSDAKAMKHKEKSIKREAIDANQR